MGPGESLLRVRARQRKGTQDPELRRRRRGRVRLASATAPPGIRGGLERRDLRGASRLPQQLGGHASPSAEIGFSDTAVHRHGRLSRRPEAPDTDGRSAQAAGASRRLVGGSSHRRSEPGGERKNHGHMPRNFRRRFRGSSRVSPVVVGQRQRDRIARAGQRAFACRIDSAAHGCPHINLAHDFGRG